MLKTLRKWLKSSNNNKKANNQSDQQKPKKLLSKNLKTNLDQIRQALGNSSDIVYREFRAGIKNELQLAVVYTDGLVDSSFIQDFILKTLMVDIRNAELNEKVLKTKDPLELLESISLGISDLKKITDFDKLLHHVLTGDTVVLLDGFATSLACDSKGWDKRSIEEPSSQTVIRGPKDGFTETIRTNTALIRRKIKDPNLRIEAKQIGTRTKTDIAIVYLEGLANSKVVEEVHRRLDRIKIDAILESGYIEELIQDETYTPFPTTDYTERPDTAAANLLEGRIVIVVDGTPFVLIVPAIFVQFLQSSEDYYQRADIASLVRFLRYVSLMLALITPAAYIAVTTFHQEMLPTPLLTNIAAQREAIPFPAIVEALLMEVTFEILREAGVRMPRAVGPAISIVGALVLGDAAVQAGIVSPAMVIVVAITAIASFVFPRYNLSIAVRILRFGFMFAAATFGLFGIILGLIIMVLHLCSLRSFGIPYLTPMGPFIRKDQKDTFFRFPLWSLHKRPHLINQKDLVREDTPAPKPPPQSEKNNRN